MAEKLNLQDAAEKAIVHPEAALHVPTTVDRSFELPTGLYVATVGLFLAYLAVMGTVVITGLLLIASRKYWKGSLVGGRLARIAPASAVGSPDRDHTTTLIAFCTQRHAASGICATGR